MTINQLQTLDENEVAMALFIINNIAPVEGLPIEFNPRNLTWIKHDALVKRIVDSFPRIKPENHTIYSSLLKKLGVQHEIRYEQPPQPVTASNQPTTGSNQ